MYKKTVLQRSCLNAIVLLSPMNPKRYVKITFDETYESQIYSNGVYDYEYVLSFVTVFC